MMTGLLEERAPLYVLGSMTEQERLAFELVLEAHAELRALIRELSEVSADLTQFSLRGPAVEPSPELKERIMGLLEGRPQQKAEEGLVVTGVDGLVQWVNPSFTEMCGYELGELRGKRLGPILQGALTDRATAGRMREAVKAGISCRERILNYHKDGNSYWVEIAITPVCDDAGVPVWLVARERELAGALAD